MRAAITISDLRKARSFVETVTERVWRAWWREQGVAREALRARFDESLGAEAIPSTFVAHQGARYLGSVVLIENDLAARPALRPWVAALWVEPAQRRMGVGAALAVHAARAAFKAGHVRVHLCATAANTPYYAKRGWSLIEEDVEGLNVFAMDSPSVLTAD
ncbi:GNAT family N-acetyltransferase [Ancylobacter pratisalsi]|uniref:GNAT family N-acetyltransferase n=1 Tax=Ancylobacter pratisalsi TaxID=1745854 RepID=A0A6P1YL19_9HYPH|nr:GNAT family N-acetyltransferase [Ancylobacter pratisalsi]QIB33825.1 GNAT family N-acetyltransferase [Ancylobacter pratisalsi]